MALIETIDYTQKIRVYEESLDPASVAANTTAEEAFAVSGVAATDYLIGITPPAALGMAVHGYVSAANQVTLVFTNGTASPVDDAAATWRFFVASAEA